MDVKKIRDDFPIFKNNPNYLYFDNAATTFKPSCVIKSVMNFYEKNTSNIHRGEYPAARENNDLYDNTRRIVSRLIHCDPNEIVFTHNATASLNQIAFGLGENFLHEGDIVLTTKAEHISNILPFHRLQKRYGIIMKYIDVDKEGNISMEKFQEAMEERVKAIVIAHITNVLGSIQPVKEICQIAHENNALVIVDGSQSVPHIPVDVVYLNCDFLVFSGHKMCAPDGVGVLYGKYYLLEKMDPIFMGGDMAYRFHSNGTLVLKSVPQKFEAGTPNIEGVIGLGKAAEYLMNIGMENICKYEKELRDYFLRKLKELPNIKVLNPNNIYGPIVFSVYGVIALDAACFLASRSIAVRSGDHCAKALNEIIGKTSTVRASIYFYNTKEEVDKFIEAAANISIEASTGSYF